MFIGEYKHNIDDKGRLALPAKFRHELGDGAVVTRGLDNCLFLYTKQEWEKLAEKLAALPIGKPDTRAFARFMLAGAMEAEIDGSGRVTIPMYLRTYAGLAKNAVVAGVHDRVELWGERGWG